MNVVQTDFQISDVFVEGQCYSRVLNIPKRQEIKISGLKPIKLIEHAYLKVKRHQRVQIVH